MQAEPEPHTAALIARLDANRLRLRAALSTEAAPAATATVTSAAGGFSLSAIGGMLRRWWHDHPMRQGGLLGAELSQRLLKPSVDRHPARWMLASALAGAVLWRVRPWRWLFRSVLIYGLLPARLRRSGTSPWPGAMAAMTWLLKQLPAPAAAPAAPAMGSPPAPSPVAWRPSDPQPHNAHQASPSAANF